MTIVDLQTPAVKVKKTDEIAIGCSNNNYSINHLLYELFQLLRYLISVVLDREHNAVEG